MNDGEIRDILPDGWLTSYVDYCNEITDSPLIFNAMAGITVLAAAAGANISFRGFGGIETWCNLYTLLIAPSGNFRKSTSLAIARRILQDADRTLVLSNEYSREAFLSNLKDQPNAIMFLTEFSANLASWSKEYNVGFKEILTELFDPVYIYKRKLQKGDIEINRPALNILAASTADWLMERLTSGDLRGGFVGRFLICGATSKERWMGLAEDKSDRAWEEMLGQYLRLVCEMKHTTVDLKGIRDKFNLWLHNLENSQTITSEMIGFISRIGTHTLKLAILFMLSKSMQKNEICINPSLDHDSLDRAQYFIERILEGVKDLTENTLVFSKTEQQLQGMLRRIGNSGIEHSQLLKLSHMKKEEFNRMIETLAERQEISRKIVKTGGKPQTVYMLQKTKFTKFTEESSQPDMNVKTGIIHKSSQLNSQNNDPLEMDF